MILEPEEYQQALNEYHALVPGPYKDEQRIQFIFFSLIVKELRQQNELLKTLTLISRREKEDGELKV